MSLSKQTPQFLASDKVSLDGNSGSSEFQHVLELKIVAEQPKSSYRRRALQSKGAVLVLMICAFVDVGSMSALNQLLRNLLNMQKSFQDSIALLFFVYIVVGVAIPQLFYPLAGWLADARFGRHRVITVSLWCVFLGQCFLSVTLLLFELLMSYSAGYHRLFMYCLFPLAFVVINIGLAGFQANIIQFGIDQMVDASGDQMSAFIHWYYWSTFVGGALLSIVLENFIPIYTLYVLEIALDALLSSIALFCWYKLKHWLVIEPYGQNPFEAVYSVIKFALKHERPIYRSALTYWDDTPPSRFDLAKSKYGGPFTTEQVENVKSFFAITGVLISLGGYIIADNTVSSPLVVRMVDKVIQSRKLSEMHQSFEYTFTVGNLATSASQVLPILLYVPICELVVYPLLRNYIPTILKRISIGITMAVIYNAVILIVYVNLHSIQIIPERYHCFLLNASVYANATLPAPVLAVPTMIRTFSEVLVYIAAFEFICAQSPYRFRGMLIGTFYAIQGFFTTIAMVIVVCVAYMYKGLEGMIGCGNIYYPIMLVIAAIGISLYALVGCKYKGRERDDHIDHHIIAENYYTSTPTDNPRPFS